MDLAFLLRAERMLDRGRPDGLDHGLLVAALGAYQSATATARAARARSRAWRAPQAPLVELLVGGASWREAARAQRGSFHRGFAAAPATDRKALSPPRLPSHFSLPSTLSPYSGACETRLPGGQGTF
jgi:hypothetical protein